MAPGDVVLLSGSRLQSIRDGVRRSVNDMVRDSVRNSVIKRAGEIVRETVYETLLKRVSITYCLGTFKAKIF